MKNNRIITYLYNQHKLSSQQTKCLICQTNLEKIFSIYFLVYINIVLYHTLLLVAVLNFFLSSFYVKSLLKFYRSF